MLTELAIQRLVWASSSPHPHSSLSRISIEDPLNPAEKPLLFSHRLWSKNKDKAISHGKKLCFCRAGDAIVVISGEVESLDAAKSAAVYYNKVASKVQWIFRRDE